MKQVSLAVSAVFLLLTLAIPTNSQTNPSTGPNESGDTRHSFVDTLPRPCRRHRKCLLPGRSRPHGL